MLAFAAAVSFFYISCFSSRHIIEERAKEFACEADRRWVLIRWGIYLQAMNAIGGSDDAGVLKTRQERNLLFPIPVAEINTNKAIDSNNPGWN